MTIERVAQRIERQFSKLNVASSNLAALAIPLARPTCKVEDCCNPVKTRKLCEKHYTRFLRHGDPKIVMRKYRQRDPRGFSPRTKEALGILAGYNASAPEVAWVLAVPRQTANRWAKIHGFVLRRDPPGQERFFSESRTHRQWAIRTFPKKVRL